jgi:hypothetical protein
MSDVCLTFTRCMQDGVYDIQKEHHVVYTGPCMHDVWCSQDARISDVCTMFTNIIMSCIQDRTCLMWGIHNTHIRHARSIVANKKVALSALVKMGMKTVDKNIDKKNKQWFGRKTHPDAMKKDIRVYWVALKHPNHCLFFLSMFLSTVFIPILTKGWKCDFFVRHNGTVPYTHDMMCFVNIVHTSDMHGPEYTRHDVFCEHRTHIRHARILWTSYLHQTYTVKYTPDPEIPDYKMLIRAGNVVWRHVR